MPGCHTLPSQQHHQRCSFVPLTGEYRNIAVATSGVLHCACIELLEYDFRRPPLSSVTSHDVPPGQLVLTSWFWSFQKSCDTMHMDDLILSKTDGIDSEWSRTLKW